VARVTSGSASSSSGLDYPVERNELGYDYLTYDVLLAFEPTMVRPVGAQTHRLGAVSIEAALIYVIRRLRAAAGSVRPSQGLCVSTVC
jgi:hypothetical protein